MSADNNTTAQADLDQFKTALEISESEETVDEPPNWQPRKNVEAPDTGSRVQCEHCDNWVLADFVRVFGDNDDKLVNGCPSCSTYREISGLDRVGNGTGRGEGW